MKTILYFTLLLAGIMLGAAPEIQMSPVSYDFGKFPANREMNCSLRLSNTGNRILKISKIHRTCGCSTAKLNRMELYPGESTQIKVGILPESVSGIFSKNIYIHSNAGKSPIFGINLRGDAIPLFKVFPQNMLYLGTNLPAEKLKTKFTIESNKSITLGKVKNVGPTEVTIQINSAGKGKQSIDINLTAPKQAGNYTIRLFIPILNPQGWKPIEIILQGYVRDVPSK